MSVLSGRRTGVYLAGQKHTLGTGRRRSFLQGRCGIFCGGAGGDDRWLATDLDPTAVSARDLFEAMAPWGYQFASPDTAFTWLNTTAMDRMDALYTYLTGTLDFPSKLTLMGGSQGGGTALLWAHRNPEKVACIVGMVPLTHLDNFHDEDRGGFAASIESAYGGLAAYNTAVPTHDPIEIAADLATENIPIRLFYSADDPLIEVAEVEEFAAIVGAEVSNIGNAGHSIDTLDPVEVLRFTEANV